MILPTIKNQPSTEIVEPTKPEIEKIGSTAENYNNFESTTDFLDDPTAELYSALHNAYQYYNTELFSGELQGCVLTINYARENALGYFLKKAFKRKDGKQADEISINPKLILKLPLIEILQTLVHEQTHQWRENNYKSSHRGYHDKKWAAKMNEVGLKPISLDKPGKETGYRVSDTVIAGGKFEAATQALLETGFDISWGLAVGASGTNGEGTSNGGADNQQSDEDRAKQKRKRKFVCPESGCDQIVWGKPSTSVLCGEHKIRMEAVQ